MNTNLIWQQSHIWTASPSRLQQQLILHGGTPPFPPSADKRHLPTSGVRVHKEPLAACVRACTYGRASTLKGGAGPRAECWHRTDEQMAFHECACVCRVLRWLREVMWGELMMMCCSHYAARCSSLHHFLLSSFFSKQIRTLKKKKEKKGWLILSQPVRRRSRFPYFI